MALELTPEELLLFRSGDEMIFTRVYHAFENELYFYIIGLVKNKVDAQSLTIDILCYLWLYRSSIQSNEHIYNYLYLTATHKSFSHLKKRRKQKDFSFDPLQLPEDNWNDMSPDPLKIAEAKDAARYVEQHVIPVINALPGINGKVAQLYYVEQMTIEEIAEALDLNRKNASGHLDYAQQKLIEKFKALASSALAYLFWLVGNLF